MLRDNNEFDEPHYPCPVRRRSFGAYARLDGNSVAWEGSVRGRAFCRVQPRIAVEVDYWS
jgi:hypothetical protein